MSTVNTVGAEPPKGPIPAEDPSVHELRPGAVGLFQSTIFGVATSAPGQSSAVTLASMVVVAAYASGPAIILSTLPMLAIALAYQRLNLWEQNCGGPYVWVGRSINPYVGYMVGWSMLVGYVLGTVSDILPLGPSVLSFLSLNASSEVGNILTATIVGLAVTVVASVGIRITARFQVVIALIEYVILLVFSGIAFYAVFVGHWHGTVHPSMGWLSLSGVGGKGSLAPAMLVAIYLFTGWDASIYINEETKKKETNPGKAVLIAVAILGPFFAWLFIAFQGVVSSGRLSSHAGSALAYIGTVLVGSAWGKFLAFAVILSVIGTTQASMVATARISYSMGTDRLMPKVFGTVSQRYRSPLIATVVWGLLTVLVADLYVVSTSMANAFSDIVSSEAVAFTIFYIFTGLATTWYYRRLLKRSIVDLLAVGLLPIAGAGVLIWILTRAIPSIEGAARWSLIGTAILGLGLMVIFAWIKRSPFFLLRRDSYQPPPMGPTAPQERDDTTSQ